MGLSVPAVAEYPDLGIKGAAERGGGPVAVVVDESGRIEGVRPEAGVIEALDWIVYSGALLSLSDIVASAVCTGEKVYSTAGG